jgi:8-oxo-dGTP pyrophosphatase MutT (NUDIX family)
VTDHPVGGALASSGPLVDVRDPAPVTTSETLWSGRIFDVVRESFDLPGAGEVTRELVRHQSAVAVLALDDADRVLLIQQYRHPVGLREWELPAGLLDVAGESPLDGAKRELHEEADVVAAEWDVLVDYLSSPGFTDEGLRIYLARGVSEVPAAERFSREAEELDMPTRWVPLVDVHEAVLRGDVRNAALVIGTLAAYAGRERGWSTLRSTDAPWPARP